MIDTTKCSKLVSFGYLVKTAFDLRLKPLYETNGFKMGFFFQAKNSPNRPRYQGETLKHHKSWGVFLSIRVSDALPTQAVPRYGPIPVKRQKCRGFWFWEKTFECLKEQGIWERVGDTK